MSSGNVTCTLHKQEDEHLCYYLFQLLVERRGKRRQAMSKGTSYGCVQVYATFGGKHSVGLKCKVCGFPANLGSSWSVDSWVDLFFMQMQS